jgi:hypothetical protein
VVRFSLTRRLKAVPSAVTWAAPQTTYLGFEFDQPT